MKLAIENDSPVTRKSVVLNNVNVVLRATGLMASAGGLFIILTNSDTFAFPGWLTPALFALFLISNFGFATKIQEGVQLRRARYNGSFVWSREPLPKPEEGEKAPEGGHSRIWELHLPLKAFKNKLQLWALDEQVGESVKNLGDEITYALFVLGLDEAGKPVLKRFHSCDDSASCERPAVHLFGYREEHDGAVWQGL